MVNGERLGNPHESEQETREIFVRSTDRLFELVDSVGQTKEQRFFTVDWDEEGEIEAAIPLRIVPTGARRQERNDGLFTNVQVRVYGEDAGPHFVWARTAAQATGTPIQLDHEALDEDFGYKVLTGTGVSEVLVERAQSLSDYLYLTREMARRNIKLSSSFQEPALKLMGEFLDQSSVIRLGQDSLDGLRHVLEGLNPRYAAKVQHALLSDILKVIVGRGEEVQRISFLDGDEAASFLEAAIRTGVIPETEAFMKRLLPTDAVYRYPFATVLLHSALRRNPPKAHAKTVVGKEIEGFICRYIATILQTRAPYARTDVEPKITGILQDLLMVSSEESDDELLVRLANLQGAGAALLAILGEMQSPDAETAAQQQQVDELSAEIVDTLLRPVINRKIGREITKRSIVLDDTPPTT